MNLAIVTARGGSKRIPRKNIRQFCGKPIIAFSIQAALEAGCFDRVMVSTDDGEIARIAMDYGAEVPFLRSPESSSDHATTAQVLIEVVERYAKQGFFPDNICCLYPTAPFVTPEVLRLGLGLLRERPEVQAVFPVVRFSFPIQRALRIREGLVSFFQPEHTFTRSQDLEPAYHDAGQFYVARTPRFMETRTLVPPGTAGIVLPEWQVQDIDNEDDWVLAEMKYRLLQQKAAIDA